MIIIISPTESNITKRGKRHPNLAEYLTNKGEKVLYVTSSFYHFEKRVFSKEELTEGKNNAIYEIKYLNVGKYSKNISIRRVFWNINFSIKTFFFLLNKVSNNDIILFPSRPTEIFLTVAILKKLKKCKLIVDVEDIWPDALLISNKFYKKLFSIYCNFFIKTGIKKVDKAFYVSENFVDWIRRYNKNINSIFIPLGIEEKYISNNLVFFDKELYKINILFIGSLQLQLDILPLCKAISYNKKRYKLIIVGENGTGDRYEIIKNFLDENKIDYEIHSFLEREKVMEIAKQCHIGVIPMISGGLPKKFFDYIGSYKPVLVLGTNGGAAIEVKKYNIGWVSSFVPEEIFKIIESINTKDLNEKISNILTSINNYKETFSLKNMYNEIIKLK